MWLEIKINNKKYLYGTFNISPNSGQQIWEELEQSIYLALNSNHDIIITGDFNINQFGNNTTKTDNLLAQFSFHQLITEPTYVTERNSSLLDLVLVNNLHSILYSEVDPPLLDQTRYHMSTIGVLNHSIKSHSSYKWKVFMFDRGDFESFRQQLSLVDWDSLLVSDDIDISTSNITRALIDAANTNIPNRVITVRKDNPPWLTSSIKRVIRRKNRLHKRAKRSNLPGHWERFRIARNKCNNLVSNAKITHYSKVSENIRLEKAGSKNWWTLVKSLTGNNECSRTIPPIEHNGNLVFDDIDKSELFNKFNLTELQTDRLRQILITEKEVEDILKIVDSSKATGPDCINPRLLREAAPILKYPLCKLFNISLSLSSFRSSVILLLPLFSIRMEIG
jgi:hypothetical protein